MNLAVNEINKQIKSSRLFKNLHCLNHTESTNNDLWKLIDKKNMAGDVVVTESQKSGRGRRGCQWFSTPKKSLTFSFSIVLPQAEKTSLLSLIIGLSIVETVNQKIKKLHHY